MGIFSRFPYTDFHRLNADWILDKIKEILGLAQDAKEAAEQAASDAENLSRGVVRFDVSQTLTDEEGARARGNIGAAPNRGTVRYDVAQVLTEAEETLARGNIGAAPIRGIVRYDTIQALSDAQKAQARSNIGALGAGDVPSGVVLYDQAQELTVPQQQQARENIGAASGIAVSALSATVVHADAAQSFSDAQKTQARSNIGAAPAAGYVQYDQAQSLSTPQKSQARSNIEAASASALSTLQGVVDTSVVKITSQSFTDAEKAQARSNIGAASATPDTGMYLETISGTDVVIQPHRAAAINNELYVCSASALNSLDIVAISSPAENWEYTIRFTSGATETTLTYSSSIIGLDDLDPQPNTVYEINVLGNYAVWTSWGIQT